ncbi:hypothetical protein HMPREF0058_1237 [Actinomyces urogenitalis DSM 15434]|uniref:Uncharacterized protein n=1 Tax=Actinomyces urogenitalis DSM 15434 TaxID=525246 RepID=C0W5U3_9ACTO|nr:hypothetical protein HMPREF0058_1237 [Actinomyces urogenitalis DSM 15434]
MIVVDEYGDEWCTYAEALEQVSALTCAATLRGWVHAGKVRVRYPFAPSRRGAMVCLTDVLPLVRDAAGAGWRRGRRARREAGA